MKSITDTDWPEAEAYFLPKGTKVHRLVEKLKKKGGVRNPYAVAQKVTGQSYATGKKLRKKKKKKTKSPRSSR